MSHGVEVPTSTDILTEVTCPSLVMKVAGTLLPASPGVAEPLLVNMTRVNSSDCGREVRENSKLS